MKEQFFTWQDLVNIAERRAYNLSRFYHSQDIYYLMLSAVCNMDGLWIRIVWFKGKRVLKPSQKKPEEKT